MAQTVVVGLDESDAAQPVADTASRLASSLTADLVAVHALEDGSDRDTVLESLRARLPSADARIVEGPAAERLLEAADDESAELLVVGSRGRGALSSALMGSVSRQLTREARCPVAVVPPAADAGEAGTASGGAVLCGVDGSGHAASAVRVAGSLARSLGSRLLVVHALPDLATFAAYPGARGTTPPLSGQPDAVRREGERLVAEAAQAAEVEATREVESGAPAEVLMAAADREDASLIVIAARGMGAVRAAFLGSVATTLCSSATRPVVVVSEAAELAMFGGDGAAG